MKPSFSAKVQKGANQGAMDPRCKGAIPLYRDCTFAAPTSPPEVQSENGGKDGHQNPVAVIAPEVDPLAVPNVRRLLLSEAASRYLSESGESAFVIVGKATYPATPGRWAVFLQPCPIPLAKDACDLVMGKAIFRRVKAAAAGTASTPRAGDRSDTPDRRPDATPANLDASPTIAGNRPVQPILAFP